MRLIDRALGVRLLLFCERFLLLSVMVVVVVVMVVLGTLSPFVQFVLATLLLLLG
jgi:hypothetical protein